MHPYLSVVIPVYNEEETLHSLMERLIPVLEKIQNGYEIIFVNDGSRDKTSELLEKFHNDSPSRVTVVDFQGNFGQYIAILAGFEFVRGDVVATLDADLQNPPEEIPKLLEELEKGGYDSVGGYRANRHDNFFRKYVSRLVNWGRSLITDIHMQDHGCMLRVYRRSVIDRIVHSKETSTFVNALGYKYSCNPHEIEVKHEARHQGGSKYSLYKLIRITFDLVTGFSLVPLQIFTMFGMVISCLSGCLVMYMLLRRFIIGPEVEGVFTLFAILYFLISVVIVGIGLIGEYVGRMYQAVSGKPRFLIKQVLQSESKKTGGKNAS